jgi:polar amino acid transport system substrate-binding protein
MKRFNRVEISLILLLVAFAPVVWSWLQLEHYPPIQDVFPTGELVVAIDPSYPPFGYLIDGEYAGIDIDLAYALADRMGLIIRFVPSSYDGIYDVVVTGTVDVSFGATQVDGNRGSATRYTWGYFNNGLVLVSPSDKPSSDGTFLTDKTLAVEYGSLADAEARLWTRRVHGLTIQYHATTDTALESVKDGTAHAAIVDYTSFRTYQANTDWQGVTRFLTDAYLAGVVRADRRAVLYYLNQTLLDILNSGQMNHILSRHF